MSDITVKELKLLRKALERDIIELVEVFEERSGVRVESIHVRRVENATIGSPAIESILGSITITTSI